MDARTYAELDAKTTADDVWECVDRLKRDKPLTGKTAFKQAQQSLGIHYETFFAVR